MELLEAGFTDFLRVGSRKRISHDLFPFTLHCLQKDEDDISEMKEMLKNSKDPDEQRAVCSPINHSLFYVLMIVI